MDDTQSKFDFHQSNIRPTFPDHFSLMLDHERVSNLVPTLLSERMRRGPHRPQHHWTCLCWIFSFGEKRDRASTLSKDISLFCFVWSS